MAYNIKRIRHVCSVKGCNNRDVVLIAKNGQIGGVYLCEECAKAAVKYFADKKSAKAVKAEEVKEEVKEEAETEAPRSRRRPIVIPKDGE